MLSIVSQVDILPSFYSLNLNAVELTSSRKSSALCSSFVSPSLSTSSCRRGFSPHRRGTYKLALMPGGSPGLTDKAICVVFLSLVLQCKLEEAEVTRGQGWMTLFIGIETRSSLPAVSCDVTVCSSLVAVCKSVVKRSI